jgi:hypothetical protein
MIDDALALPHFLPVPLLIAVSACKEAHKTILSRMGGLQAGAPVSSFLYFDAKIDKSSSRSIDR